MRIPEQFTGRIWGVVALITFIVLVWWIGHSMSTYCDRGPSARLSETCENVRGAGDNFSRAGQELREADNTLTQGSGH